MNQRKSPRALFESLLSMSVSYPLRVTLIYAFFGGIWILGSDQLAAWLFPNSRLLIQASTYKGWFFVAVTASLLYLEINREYRNIERMNAELENRVEARTRELRKAQEQLIQQERVSVLGQLAGGVAHELRNPLGVISNAVYFLKLILPDASEKVHEYLDILTEESQTASKLAADLLNYSNIQTGDRYPVATLELVGQTLDHHPAPAGVTVQLDIPPDLPPAYVDTRQIVQVLDNLVLNAYQAMLSPAGMISGGKLTISARRKGDMLAIAIQDTGEGIQPENFSRLFEPLFTTKPKGIGLGLAVSKKLIEANGGKIELESEPGRGSTFMVYLPIKVEVQA